MKPTFFSLCILTLGAVVLAACGDGADSASGPHTVLVPDTEGAERGALQPLSGVSLTWQAEHVQVEACPGRGAVNLDLANHAGHAAENLWFTHVYYEGYEYVAGHRMSPQGGELAPGEQQTIRYEFDLDDAFASAGDRKVRVAVIAQTDNPDWGDPEAFFRLIWVTVRPAGDCGVAAGDQPPAEPVHIHSVACGGHLIRLQMAPRLVGDDARVRVRSGADYLASLGEPFLEPFHGRPFWWADLLVTAPIPPGRAASVEVASSGADSLFFHFSPRMECGGGDFVNFRHSGAVSGVGRETDGDRDDCPYHEDKWKDDEWKDDRKKDKWKDDKHKDRDKGKKKGRGKGKDRGKGAVECRCDR